MQFTISKEGRNLVEMEENFEKTDSNKSQSEKMAM